MNWIQKIYIFFFLILTEWIKKENLKTFSHVADNVVQAKSNLAKVNCKYLNNQALHKHNIFRIIKEEVGCCFATDYSFLSVGVIEKIGSEIGHFTADSKK